MSKHENGLATWPDDGDEGSLVMQTLFLRPNQVQVLHDQAAKEHVSPGEIVRRAISEYVSAK